MTQNDIAPCGINCSLCYAFQREKNRCSGCNGSGIKPAYCQTCVIRMCDKKSSEQELCGSCEPFPCKRLKTLYKRYAAKYGSDILQNLSDIRSAGMQTFLAQEEKKWKCASCGQLLCMHKEECAHCGQKNPYHTAQKGVRQWIETA